ncbi:hypothetical protein [Lysobacter panacisoli]|uniref:DUF3619 family protein n=1 Tax=Lysobacter panacisoli TaxID=1255263 RepID=A0ABP9L8R6_9GAMM|nr:hypothetical protein [Lysobacter panacisoli]
MNDSRSNDARFDQAMRDLHAQSLSQVSSATRARLRVARHAAATPVGARDARPGPRWMLASGIAAVCALVIGLQLRPDVASPTTPSAPTIAAAPTIAYDTDTALAVLDENPDLYLWLASNDDAVPSLEH